LQSEEIATGIGNKDFETTSVFHAKMHTYRIQVHLFLNAILYRDGFLPFNLCFWEKCALAQQLNNNNCAIYYRL